MENAFNNPNPTTPLQEDSNHQTCVVCLTHPAQVTYTPCHHHVVCVACDVVLLDKLTEGAPQPCPVCRSFVMERTYPTVPVFVYLLNGPMMVVEVSLLATVWELKAQILTQARLRRTPRLKYGESIPSDYTTLATLGVTPNAPFDCLPRPPPPLECLLHRLSKIRQRITFHRIGSQRASGGELDMRICQERERNVLNMLREAYGYQESCATSSVQH